MSYSAGWRLNSAQTWGGNANFRQHWLVPKGGTVTTSIVGVSRDSTGAALGNCVVQLLRSGGDILTQSTVSDGSGNFTFPQPGSGPFFIRAYIDGSPNLAGITDRNLIAT